MQEIYDFFSIAFLGFDLTDAIDILIVAFVVYELMKLILETRAEQIFKGVIILIAAAFFANLFNLHTLGWICKGALALGAVAILIVFQPELRRALEFMGRGKFVKSRIARVEKEAGKEAVSAIVEAVRTFSSDKTGALIIFERKTVLEDIAETGTIVDAKISDRLLGSIFYEGSPLHDGAVIINKRGLYAAGCVLPLTKRQDISKSLGTRHRAGIGITENSDALVIIVSEETGIISMAENGRLERLIDVKTVERKLLDMYLSETNIGGKLSRIPGVKNFFNAKNEQDGANGGIRGGRKGGGRPGEAADAEKSISESVADEITKSAARKPGCAPVNIRAEAGGEEEDV